MIKFFATNRATEHLGRILDRPTRHKLSEGGYYFVNMDQYMKFYLRTTDTSTMPKNAVMLNSKEDVFDNFLSDDRIGAIVVCVHGFNVELYEAFTWFRILTDTMKHLPKEGEIIVTSPEELKSKGQASEGSLTAFIGFSWPSNGNMLSYSSDQKEAIASKAAFSALLARLKATGKSVNLIGHSMGNFLVCHTLAALVDKQLIPPSAINDAKFHQLIKRGDKNTNNESITREGDEWLIDNYVMIAPDVERRHITKCDDNDQDSDYVGQFYSGLQHLVRRKINLYSRYDGALAISDIQKVPREVGFHIGDGLSKLTLGLLDFLERNPDQRWEKRLGEAPAPPNAAPGFTSINATELANRKIDHSDHIDCLGVVASIVRELDIT